MKLLSWLLTLAVLAPLYAAVDGVVTNKTTGQPQSGANVALVKLAEDGSGSILNRVTTGADGRFAFPENLNGICALETEYAGVLYSQVIPPMLPPNNLQVAVYETTSDAAEVKLDQHIVFVEPGQTQMVVSESFVLNNGTQRTLLDPRQGSLRFVLPAEAKGIVQVSFIGPDQRPRLSEAKKTSLADVYQVADAVPPGESRFDLSYVVPYAGGEGQLQVRTLRQEGRTRVVAAPGVTLEGDGLVAMGAEPRTQAQIFSLSGAAVTLKIRGSGSITEAPAEGEAAESPRIRNVKPSVYDNLPLITGAGGMALLFALMLLYRKPSAPGKDRGQS
ncbi:MAG: carboxypeptidase-like regulatory domain-containing protein [Bryobacterales bacterium]|jgi:hypothetical protein|nr:carboxypeptidase-like regulatory domain-containing protein [Bryobacterales bacterium]